MVHYNTKDFRKFIIQFRVRNLFFVMSLKKYILLYERIDKLINTQSTGSLEELAFKLDISKRQVSNYIRDLQAIGKKIKYSRKLQSYIYEE